jgi:UDPglucose 6-dehydrogenase
MSLIDLSSPIGISDESSCEESTGPTTPDSSPLFCASRLEDVILTPLGDLLDPRTAVDLFSVKKADNVTFPVKPVRGTSIQRGIRNICVIGAGYVGRCLILREHSD